PRQDQECRLEGILGGVWVAEDLMADPQHHRAMPTHQRLEGDLPERVAAGREPGQELAVRYPLGHRRLPRSGGRCPDSLRLPTRHDPVLPKCDWPILPSYWGTLAGFFQLFSGSPRSRDLTAV